MTAPLTFTQPGADFFVPDGCEDNAALTRTTHLAIGAHSDDLEVFAAHGIEECFQRSDRWFGGVTVTNGAGSPRAGRYADHDGVSMIAVRLQEQRKAAFVGEYGFQAQLAWPSAALKDTDDERPTNELEAVLQRTRPQLLYTHNLCDKHDTHIAVTMRVLEAVRRLDPSARPSRVLGCEVWRDLDWMADAEKVVLDCGERDHLQSSLIGVFDSQIAGGKRYDLAVMGRRRANATFFESHGVDQARWTCFAMDLTPLIEDAGRDPTEFALAAIDRFRADVEARLQRFAR